MTPEESIRFRSCLFGTGLVLLPLLAGIAGALPYGVDGNGTSFTVNATSLAPWENVTGGSVTLYPQAVNGSWPRPNVTTANGTVLYSFTNSTTTPPSAAPDLYWGGFQVGTSGGSLGGVITPPMVQLMLNWTWRCGAENASLRFWKGGWAWATNLTVHPLNRSANWSAPTGLDTANNSSNVTLDSGNVTDNSSLWFGPFNRSQNEADFPFGIVVRSNSPPGAAANVVAEITFNVTTLCANTTIAVPNGTRLPLNVTTPQGSLAVSGSVNTDGWQLTVTSDQAGSWNASSAGVNFSGAFGTPRKVKAGSPAIWGVLANGSTCAGFSFAFAGNMSAVCLYDQATNTSAPAYSQVQTYAVSSGGGGGGGEAAPLSAPAPSPAAQTQTTSSSSSLPAPQTSTYSPAQPVTVTTGSGVDAVVNPTYTEYTWEVG